MGEGKRQKRPRARRSEPTAFGAGALDPQQLLARIATLESRVSQLERTLTPEPAPVEEAAAGPNGKPKPRCPGCHLPVETTARGRCPWCGFIFQAVALATRPRRKLG